MLADAVSRTESVPAGIDAELAMLVHDTHAKLEGVREFDIARFFKDSLMLSLHDRAQEPL